MCCLHYKVKLIFFSNIYASLSTVLVLGRIWSDSNKWNPSMYNHICIKVDISHFGLEEKYLPIYFRNSVSMTTEYFQNIDFLYAHVYYLLFHQLIY